MDPLDEPRQAPAPPPQDLALRQFDAVVKHFIYENSIFWTRGSFFFAGHAALFAFTATNLHRLTPATWVETIPFLVISLCGIIMSWWWWLSVPIADRWLRHWAEVLQAIEPLAFGDLLVYRRMKEIRDEVGSVRALQTRTIGMIGLLWGFALIYTVVFLVGKLV